jgi:hypothetical protein
VRPGFTVEHAWRDELYRRLMAGGVVVERPLYDAGAPAIDRTLRNRIATIAFGDSTAMRMALDDDRQLLRALELLEEGRTQQDLFVIAQRIAAANGQSRRR